MVVCGPLADWLRTERHTQGGRVPLRRRGPHLRSQFAEAAHILGVSRATVHRQVHACDLPAHGGPQSRRRLSRREVEQLAVARYDRNHPPGPDSYWVTRPEAARILDVNRARVWQLAQRGFLPSESAPDGTRLYRPGAAAGHRQRTAVPAVGPFHEGTWCSGALGALGVSVGVGLGEGVSVGVGGASGSSTPPAETAH